MTFSAGQCCTNSASMPSSRGPPASSWGVRGSKLRGCLFTDGAWIGSPLHRAWKLSAVRTAEGGAGEADPSSGVGGLSTCRFCQPLLLQISYFEYKSNMVTHPRGGDVQQKLQLRHSHIDEYYQSIWPLGRTLFTKSRCMFSPPMMNDAQS